MPPQVKRAVIVGIDDYEDDRIENLTGARNDAQELRDRLAENDEFSIDSILVDGEATGDAIRAALSDLLWRTDAADISLLYFSGHGFVDEYGNGFLAPADIDYKRPLVRGIRMQEVKELMRAAKNKDVILLMIDACHSGIAAGDEKGLPEATPIDTMFTDLADTAVEGRGRIVLASSGADQKSRELPECTHEYTDQQPHPHGVMTYRLLEGLSGQAAEDGSNVTLADLHAFLEGSLKAAHNQTLTFEGSGLQNSAEIHLVRATQFADIMAEIEKASDRLDNDSPEGLFSAVYILKNIHNQAANNNEAKSVIGRVNERLQKEMPSTRGYMLSNGFELRMNCHDTYSSLEKLFVDMSFDSLVVADPGLMEMLFRLWDASRNPGDQAGFRDLLQALTAFEAIPRGQTPKQEPRRAAGVSSAS